MKSVIRIACFMLLLVCVLSGVNRVLKVKYSDGIYSVTKFYEQERNSVDVLVLGSSHAFVNINTGLLWDEYGIAAYNLGASAQPLWNTYYYLKEALKTQKPELIILEGYMLPKADEYDNAPRIIKNTYGLNWSADKIEAIKVSTPQDQWIDFFPGYVQYHTRYKELSSADFLKNQGDSFYENWKGFEEKMTTMKMELRNPDALVVNERMELQEKTEKYYRMIIELAQENNIPIVVLVSPYPVINEVEQAQFNRAQDIAAEYGIEFINYNSRYQEIGIDYTTDVADESHLNFRGNQKFTAALGEYLVDHYEISDRRGDGRYQSWQDGADYIRANEVNQELREAVDREAFLEKARNEDYLFFVSADGECDIKNENIHKILNTFGISYNGTNEMWKSDVNGVEWYSGEQEAEFYCELNRHNICLKKTWNEEAGAYTNEILVDTVACKTVNDGVNVTIYSTATQKVVDSVGFDAEEDYQLIR